jgi:hypothetical protein
MTDSKCACDESLRLRERVLLLRHFIDTAAWSILRDSGKPATAVAHWLEGRLADDNRLAQAEETSAKTDSEPGGTLTTDGAPLGTVARGVFACALAWEPDARLLGNVRAADIARLAEFVLKAEETSVEEKKAEPYKPKVGDRVRLVSSPDDITDSDKVGQTWAITGIRQGTGEHASDPSYHWRVRNELATWDTFIHRDAVWEPVAEKPEPPASELSDGALEEIFLGFASIRLGYRALYDAGRAKAENELVRLATGLIEAFEAECEPEADADDGDLPPHKAVDCAFRLLDEKTARIAKLEAERAAHAATKAEFDEVIRGLYARLREVHADARKARPMPTREAIGEALKKHSALASGVKSSPWLSYADAVLALFGAQEEQDSAPGEPGNTQKLGCYDCGRDYTLGPDLVVSNEDWARIAPNPPDGGVLCPNCMHDRFVKILGNRHTAGGIRAEFMSGPFAKLAPAQPSLEGVLEESASDSRLQAEARKLGIREHEWRCPCDVCSRTSQLCPASRAGLSGLVEDVKARLAAQSLEGMPREWRERLSDLESRVAKLERGH